MTRNKKLCVVFGILTGIITITFLAVRKIKSKKPRTVLENL